MSRSLGPKGKVCRRFNMNLFGNPKFDRLISKRPVTPGMHGVLQGRKKISEYGMQLAEKQKLKYIYGLKEAQFRANFHKAQQQKGITSDNLMILLERRLDNVVYRLGFATTRSAARQIVTHGHIKVNGRRVNIPSFLVRGNDVITVKENTTSTTLLRRMVEESSSREMTPWLDLDKATLRGLVQRLPLRSEIPTVAREQLVVELYSK
jgi:small subunit ribosomal protein S4